MKYDFKCEDHGVFEIDQKMSETTKTHPCPDCGKESPKYFDGKHMFNCPRADGDYKLKNVDLGKKKY